MWPPRFELLEHSARPALRVTSPGWMADALCRQTDPEMFYPISGEHAETAKAVCTRCPVRSECLEWALSHGERFGVFGGLTPQERARLRRTA